MTLPSLREQNKQQKLDRIKQAAKQLFEQKGYEATTTREIAEQARIGTGTLFLYARDKVELLMLIYQDALGEVVNEAVAALPADLSLQEALMQIFTALFHFYAQNPENTRVFLKELLFQPGEQSYRQSFRVETNDLLGQLTQLVAHAQERGEIRQDVNPRLAATGFFALYFACVTSWLGSFLALDAATFDQLRALLDLQIKGLLP